MADEAPVINDFEEELTALLGKSEMYHTNPRTTARFLIRTLDVYRESTNELLVEVGKNYDNASNQSRMGSENP